MPGVPSSRGCQQCRKQKKKCSTATSSSCQRCVRLHLPCAGLGLQRYKFVTEEPYADSKVAVINVPWAGLHNDETRLASSLAHAVDPSIGVDISLSLNFGGFLVDVPRRLGKHKALDATATAFVAAYSWFKSGRHDYDSRSFRTHGLALKALAESLNDPVAAQSSETLCAIHLMLIYQTFLGSIAYTSHAAGIAQILRSRGSTDGKNDFEKKILLSQRGTLVIEALTNDRIFLSQQDWHDVVECKLDVKDPDGLWLHCLAQLPSLMRRARSLRDIGQLRGPCLAQFAKETHETRTKLQSCLKDARAALAENDLGILATYDGPAQWKTVAHAIRSRRYGLVLTAAMTVNILAQNFTNDTLDYEVECREMALETLELADVAQRYRPFGSMYIILCLSIANIATTDPVIRARTLHVMQDFRAEFIGWKPHWVYTEQYWLEQRFKLQEVGAYEQVFSCYE